MKNKVSMKNKSDINELITQLEEKYKPMVLLYSNLKADTRHEFIVTTSALQRYEIGSATKMFTALSVLFLAEKNRLSLQDPIADYLPKDVSTALFINDIDYSQVSIESVLNHTSGLGEHLNSGDDDALLSSLKGSPDNFSLFDIIDMCKENKFQPFETPYTQFQYSNLGYILLGHIIEKVTNASYQTFIKEQIFAPLKMTNSDFLSDLKNDAPIGYFQQKIISMPATLALSAGEIVSTPHDMGLFLMGVFSDFTSKKIQTLIIDSIENSINKDMHYGFGFYKENDMIGHSGGTFGFSSKAFINHTNKKYFIASIPEGNTGAELKSLFSALLQ